MSNIINEISKIEKLYHAKGCSDEQIKVAESELGIEFPSDYIEIIKEFGAISFYGTEWTGLNVPGYLNVVEATKKERELNNLFPRDCFVLENLAIDGIVMACNKKGQVYAIQENSMTKECNTLVGYLKICLARECN